MRSAAAKGEVGSCSSFAGVSRETTEPWASVRILSHPTTNRKRCAMDSTVASPHCSPMTSSKRSAEERSKLEVHSSKTSTLGRRTSARATTSSWRCAADRAPTANGAAKASAALPSAAPPVPARARASRPQRWSAARASASESSSPKFAFSPPATTTASCGTTAKAARASCNRKVERSTPSMSTRPEAPKDDGPATGQRRSSNATSVDLPLPVRPMMPSRSPARTSNVTSRSAGGAPGR
mmetsp:Transcript_24552/g.69758  ORF Transcript_24552/g.69758 Transcript_24552/m.69758 type:complete len:239 (+) Transcript_24552:112-828(+)